MSDPISDEQLAVVVEARKYAHENWLIGPCQACRRFRRLFTAGRIDPARIAEQLLVARAEVERLREALRRIADGHEEHARLLPARFAETNPEGWRVASHALWWAQDISKTALGKEREEADAP